MKHPINEEKTLSANDRSGVSGCIAHSFLHTTMRILPAAISTAPISTFILICS